MTDMILGCMDMAREWAIRLGYQPHDHGDHARGDYTNDYPITSNPHAQG